MVFVHVGQPATKLPDVPKNSAPDRAVLPVGSLKAPSNVLSGWGREEGESAGPPVGQDSWVIANQSGQYRQLSHAVMLS